MTRSLEDEANGGLRWIRPLRSKEESGGLKDSLCSVSRGKIVAGERE